MPSSSSTLMTPPIRPSVFFEGSAASSFTRRQSGRIEEKIFACFTWPHMTTSVMPSCFQDVDQLAELRPARSSGSGRQRFDFRRRLLLDGDHRDVVPEPLRAFQRQQREPAVAGDEPVRAST